MNEDQQKPHSDELTEAYTTELDVSLSKREDKKQSTKSEASKDEMMF